MKIGRRAFLSRCDNRGPWRDRRIYLPSPFQARQLSAAEKQACGLTVEATEGPYHVSDMPELKDGNLNFTNLAGRANRNLRPCL